MASGENPSPSKGQKLSASSSSSRNDCEETQWMLLPNNLEINSRSQPSKKQRNKEKLRSFPQENLSLSVNMAEGYSNETAAFQNYPRAKCNTASWLKDQLVNDEKARKKVRASDEVFPDTDISLPRSCAMNFPVSHTIDVAEHPEEYQRPPSRRSIAENENTKSLKDDCKKNQADSAIVFQRLSQLQDFISEARSLCQELEISDEPVLWEECNRIKDGLKQASEGEQENKILLQQMASEKSFVANGTSPPSASKTSNSKANVSHRDSNASAGFCSEEEHSNKCKNLIEELQQFAGTPMSSKLQEMLLYYMQKKSGNKLALYQGSSNLGSHDNSDIESKRSTHDQMLPCTDDPHNVSSNSAWIVENVEEQNAWAADNAMHSSPFDEGEKQLSNWKEDPRGIKQMHISLERIRKRVQSMQQNTDIKNVTRSLSSDDCEISNVGERVAAVEFERKKLKNKLVELQEKKKMNDVLLQELSYLKDATLTASLGGAKGEDGSQFTLASSRNQHLQPKNKKRSDSSLVDANRKLYKLQTTLQHLEGMMKSISPEEFVQDVASVNESAEAATPRNDNRNMRSGASLKRDNVRKEINSGFPARRHYEAEGRANEDPDIPNAPIAIQPAVAGKWQGHPEIQEKLRKLQVAQKHVKVINDIMTSIRESKKAGRPIPIEHLSILSSLEREENNEFDNDLSSSDSEEEVDDLEPLIPESSPENVCTNVKEVYAEGDRAALHQSDVKPSVEGDKFITVMKDVMTSLQECEKSGKPIPVDHLRILADMYKDKDSDSNDGSEDDYDVILRDNTSAENMIAQIPSSLLHQTDDHNRHEASSAVPYNVENAANEKENASSYQSLIHQLMELYHPSVEQRSDDMVRSSGEGGYMPNKNHASSLPVSSDQIQSVPPLQFCRHQDNLLLTRQNIATMESQNQSCSRRSHTKDRSTKKDNINNLSGKIGKLTIQNAVHASFSPVADGPRDNIDSVSMLSSELNQSHSGEGERKTILDILKRGKKKQKGYDRNQDNQIRSNSSIDSELLESSNSALAANTTVAATWGGSSTQENFEDENEPSGNDQEQHVVGTCAALGSNYDTPKTRKICKMGTLRGATSGASNELPTSVPCSRDAVKDYQQQMSSNFMQQLKKQIDQLNALCQGELLSEGSPSLNFFPNNQNLLSACPPPQAVPDIIHPYNQQLLLCLSQCYHTLYMQQLEIQHLHRCLRHNVDTETVQHANNLNPQSDSAEDIGFRPWCMPTCSNPIMPSTLYPNGHISPRSSATYLPLPLKPYPSHSTQASGTRPVRAVIHPASQENRSAQETLNNQVPPRTRANNFWDNFRSYSRQNLLSTSNNVKRNENIGFPVAPQIRQVHPMVSNESINQQQEIANSYVSALPSDFNRSLHNPDRALHNSDLQDLISRSKKPNSSTPISVRSRYADFHKKGSLVNINTCGDRNARSGRYHGHSNGSSVVPPVSNPPSVNLIQLYPNQDESKVGNFSSICPTSTEAVASHSTPDPSNFPHWDCEHQSDFLLGLYRDAKSLKSDVQRQQALNIIRTLALSEKAGDSDLCQNKVRNDNPSSSNKLASVVNPSFNASVSGLSVETGTNAVDGIDTEKPSGRLLSESSLPWMNQNLPTAAIPPLSKQVPSRSVSTGAVRKRPKIQSTCFWDSLSSNQACSLNAQDVQSTSEDFNAPSLQPIRKSASDFPANIVESIIVDLQFALPFGQMREDSSLSFWSSINAYIISRIRANMPVPLPHKSLASLRQTLDHVLTRFSGMKFCDCEAEFLKYISQLLYESLTNFMSTGRFTSSPPFLTVADGSSVLESVDKPEDLCVKIPADTDKIRELSINMPTDDVFLPQFQAVLQQNVLSTTETQDNANVDNIQSVAVIPTEEEVACEWGPEAEAEPEVEAGTEADLAEADQSPGQQGNISNSSQHVVDACSVDQSANALRNGPLLNEELEGTLNDTPEVVIGAHFCPDSCVDQEANLDDVPTKLCSTEEEPQKLEEEIVHLSSSDDVKENNEPFLEGKSENEVTSSK